MQPTDYEGKIVDRYSQGQQRPGSNLFLTIEAPEGKRFTVEVDSNTYQSARVGMRIRSRSGQIVLIESGGDLSGDK